MKMYIKESYVYQIEHVPGARRWVGCNGEDCGYERTLDDSNNQGKLFRMFKVNGMQICEECLKEWHNEIRFALLYPDCEELLEEEDPCICKEDFTDVNCPSCF